jgi:hypothetical protein
MPRIGSPGNDEFMDEITLQGFSVGTPAFKVPLDAYTFQTDKIYRVIITGANPYDVVFTEITEIGTISWDTL